MFKSLFLVALLAFLPLVHADFFLVLPFEQKLFGGDIVDIGAVSSGETFEVSISDETFFESGVRWSKVEISQGALPVGWVVLAPNVFEKRFLLKISVPKNALPNIYSFKVLASNESLGLSEEFTVRVLVKENLFSAAINNPALNQFPLAGEKVVFDVVLRNDSIASHSVKVFSSLPRDWFEELQVVVGSGQTVNAKFEVFPKVVGKRDFKIIVSSNLSQKEVAALGSSVMVRPTIIGKLSAPENGYPFFSFSLGAFYFFNSFLFSFFS